MKKGHSLFLLLLVAIMLTAVLSACSDGKGEAAANQDGSSEEQAVVTGGTVTAAITADLSDSLDPHMSATAGTREILFNIFEGLVKVNADGDIIPALATGYSFSDDGQTLTFPLRQGVKFHNGAEVTADDVVYSIKRCAGLLGEGSDVLVTAFSVVDRVESDGSTVTVHMTERNLEIIYYFASTSAAILPADYAQQDTRPVGTGPFRFDSRTVGESITLVRNEDYWGEAPALDKVVIKVVDEDSLVMGLKSGAVDFAAHLTSDQANELGDGFTVAKSTMNLVQGLFLNNAAEPFTDVRVRQAVCYAVDKAELCAFLDGVEIGSAMYPAFTRYFSEALNDLYPHDAEKARSLLAEAGYPDGISFSITVASEYTQHVQTAEILVDQLKEAGINAEIKTVDWTTWYDEAYKGRNFEATVVGFDASSAFTARAMVERYVSDSGKNFLNFSSSAFDAAFAEAVGASDEESQTEAYQDCLNILADEAASVFLEDLRENVAMADGISGYVSYPIYVLDFAGLTRAA